jgi:hypothetical protein
MKNASNLYTRREFIRSGVLGGALAYSAPAFLLSTMKSLHAATAKTALQGITGARRPDSGGACNSAEATTDSTR